MEGICVEVNLPIYSERVVPGDKPVWPEDKAKFYARHQGHTTLPNGQAGPPKPFVTILTEAQRSALPQPKVDPPEELLSPQTITQVMQEASRRAREINQQAKKK